MRNSVDTLVKATNMAYLTTTQISLSVEPRNDFTDTLLMDAPRNTDQVVV